MAYYSAEAERKEKLQKKLRLIYWSIVPILILTIALAWVFYPEPYEFHEEFISNLGGYTSDQGLTNTISSTIMAVGFGLCALIALILTIIYLIKANLDYNYLKSLLNFILALGAVGVGIPMDHPTVGILHGVGALIFIFGFGILNFVLQTLRFKRKYIPKGFKEFTNYALDLLMVTLVFVIIFLLAVFYIIHRLIDVYLIDVLTILSQKAVLIVDFIAIFFLDKEDM
ncbi:MAG: hypothetical protein GF308_09245 [Candidatus Heimdallarchaeota archaeon]|nr:hypothetical protein [Candidatus Heimdallarchaeota archaeon]